MSHDGQDKASVANLATSVAMKEAIKTSTTQLPCKVLEAELESENRNVLYEVEIVNAAVEIRTFEIEAQSGKLLSSEPEDEEGPEKSAFLKNTEKS
ncbi:MAG: hypothetical protein NPIRA03_34030 [Nitrospirales bacterium]|nr:MAG: hypothetical protein NPIRA03_34030 [Nitrospirales bacterium]